VCNKLVVLALGTTGALTIWAPLQPVVAAASMLLLGWALGTRLAAERSCRSLPVPGPGRARSRNLPDIHLPDRDL
jgi:hypothetical protein